MLGKDFRRHKHPVHHLAGADHPLIFGKQVRENAGKSDRDSLGAIGHGEGDGLALPALQRARFDKPAQTKHLAGFRRL